MRMQIASISSYAFNDTIFQTIASIISISEIERFDQDESVFDSRFFRISESNWMNTFLWIYSSVELRKEANFKSTGAPIALFSSRWPSHGINALGLPLLPVRERCSTCEEGEMSLACVAALLIYRASSIFSIEEFIPLLWSERHFFNPNF